MTGESRSDLHTQVSRVKGRLSSSLFEQLVQQAHPNSWQSSRFPFKSQFFYVSELQVG